MEYRGYKASIKRFYKWLGFAEVFEGIKYRGEKTVNKKSKPGYIISQDQVDLLIYACDHLRDKAIISLLYDI